MAEFDPSQYDDSLSPFKSTSQEDIDDPFVEGRVKVTFT